MTVKDAFELGCKSKSLHVATTESSSHAVVFYLFFLVYRSEVPSIYTMLQMCVGSSQIN